MGFSGQGEIKKIRKTASVANPVFTYVLIEGKSLHDKSFWNCKRGNNI